ncbi:MAG: hypothetical protein JNK74_23265 [Candidatus Hydrogenedentes bacterium]|nr:hypothetical protein [Candidatus Hydrogenedentota bacterium]
MRQPWGKSDVDGAKFKMAASELDRMYDEMPRLPEPPAQAEGEGSAPPGTPPRSQPQTIAPAPAEEEHPAECTNPACARAFTSASETGAPLVQGSGSGCTDERKAVDKSKIPNPDRRKS